MEIKCFDFSAGQLSSSVIAVNEKVFGCDYNEPLIHQVVEAYRAASRAGTKAQKSRSEVSGGGRKPFRQKGTGQARAGTNRSPLWRTGGVTFAAKPRNYEQKVNRKMYLVAMRSILSELLKSERLLLVEKIETTGKTKDFARLLKPITQKRVLVITDTIERNLYLSVRNLPNVWIQLDHEINPLDLIAFDKIICSVGALKKIEERLV